MKPLRIIVAGGGTGGHLYPGIAVARELLRRQPDAKVTFAGTARGIEARVIPREGFELDLLRSAGIKGTSPVARMRGLMLLPLGGLDAWRILSRRSPDVVIGVGGYSSGPVVLAAALRRIPTLLMEQNAVPGLTNRTLARVVDAAAVTFDETITYFERRGFVTGNPVREEFFEQRGGGRACGGRRHASAEGFDLWGLPGGARDQRGHGGGGAAVGSPAWPAGDHASDRRARSGTRPRRVSAGGPGGPGGAVPVRHGW